MWMGMQQAVVVLGSHRSGTSLVANILNQLGVYLRNDFPADKFNQRGYWEDQKLVELNEELLEAFGGSWRSPPVFPPNWAEQDAAVNRAKRARELLDEYKSHEIWGWKDPRLSLTLPFWFRLLPANTSFVICIRSPLSVVRSLEQRDSISAQHASRIWLTYNLHAFSNVMGKRSHLIFYDDILDRLNSSLENLVRFIGLPMNQNVTRVVTRELRHHEEAYSDVVADQTLPIELKLLYSLLMTSKSNDEAFNQVKLMSSIQLQHGGLPLGAGEFPALDARSYKRKLDALQNSYIVRVARKLRLVKN
jgi:hypothetical protein